jgi:hypothetical protein
MDDSSGWGLSRYVTLLVVVTLHMALLAALVMTSGAKGIPTPTVQTVELLFLPPVNPPKVRAENNRPRRSSGDAVKTIAPRVSIEAPSPSLSPRPASSSDGSGSGVDWAAEARRALQAFEIRKNLPSSNNSVSSKPGEDNWWPKSQHHAGERFKTANGDWIVWINASCYQLASSGLIASALPPQTICPDPDLHPKQ